MTSTLADGLHFLTISEGRRIQMKHICIADEGFVEKNRDIRYSLIWAGLWIVALMALLALPAVGR
jgi:hypothetical protein